MPTVSARADDLRATFGAEEFTAGLRECGYFASENGRTIDTRKSKLTQGVTVAQMVIGQQAPSIQKGARGR